MRQGAPGEHTGPSLSWLLAPLTVDTFFDEVWGATHHHAHGRGGDHVDGLLDGADSVDDVLALFRPHVSLVALVREDLRKDHYVYRLGDGSLDAAAIGRDFAEGFTIVLDSVQRYAKTIGVLAQSIEAESNFAAQINAYFTPPRSQGFVAHFDDHDALIVQLLGSKIWHLYDGIDVAPHDMSRHQSIAADELPDPVDVRLATGDVLYVPRGRVHAAESTSELSVHLTIGLHAPTLLMLATRALNALSDADERVHAQLPPRFLSDPVVRSGLGAFAHQIAECITTSEAVAAGLDSLEADLIRRGQCPPLGAAISDAVTIDDQSRVVKRQPLYSRVVTRTGGVALQFAQSEVNVAADHEDALRFLAESTVPVRVCDLPGLAEVQRIELARALVMQGFLIRLPDR